MRFNYNRINFNLVWIAILLLFSISSCKKTFNENDIQTNPNAVTDVDVKTLLSGALLGVSFLHEDTDVRIASIWAGELNGLSRAHQGFAQYIVSSQTFSWSILYPVASQARLLQTKATAIGDKWTKGVAEVLEVLVVEKITDLYGNVPYTQAFDEIKFPNPSFDDQAQIYSALQQKLDDAIADLSSPTGLALAANDFIYQGNVQKWKAAANSLKARLYLHTGQYAQAAASAALGISTTGGDALTPHGNSQGVDTNQNYDFFKVSRAGDTGFEGAFLPVLLRSRINSVNTKTNEQALYNHFIKVGLTATNGLDPNTADGAFTADAPHPLITFYETQLILAEAKARLGDLNSSLLALNKVRAQLALGYINGKTFSPVGRKYDDYIIGDFIAGGLANGSNQSTPQNAILYEIISQKYILLLMQYEAFNDYRRLAKALPIVQLPIPLYAGVKKPERFLYPQDEINANLNVPRPAPDQFTKIPIYQ